MVLTKRTSYCVPNDFEENETVGDRRKHVPQCIAISADNIIQHNSVDALSTAHMPIECYSSPITTPVFIKKS